MSVVNQSVVMDHVILTVDTVPEIMALPGISEVPAVTTGIPVTLEMIEAVLAAIGIMIGTG